MQLGPDASTTLPERSGQRGVPAGDPGTARSPLAAITASLLAHACALVWIAGYQVPARSGAAELRTPPAAATPAPEAPPLVVELIDLDAAPRLADRTITIAPATPDAALVIGAPPLRATARPRPRPPAPGALPARALDAAMTAIRPPGGEVATRTGAPAERSPATLRPALDGRPSPEVIDELGRRSAPLVLPPPALNTAAHAGDDQIARLETKLDSPLYRATASADQIADAEMDLRSLVRERDDLTMKPIGGGRYRNDQASFHIDIAPDGTVAIHDRPGGLGAALDLEGAIMRARGEDPDARAKLRFLDKTREERAELGRRHRTELLSRSAELMRANIDWLWSMTRDPAKRREGLFDLWDECAETGEAELVTGGEAARRMVIGEIRARLRGADRYPPAELARFNARRRSTARFAPYDEAPATRGTP